MTRSDTSVEQTQIEVDDGNTESFKATTYKTISVKEAGVMMYLLQQTSNNQGVTQTDLAEAQTISGLFGKATQQPETEGLGAGTAPAAKAGGLLTEQLLRW